MGIFNDYLGQKDEADEVLDAVESITSISTEEKWVLKKLKYEHHVGHHWSVGYGDTQYVMTSLVYSRKKADSLIMKVLKVLDKKYGY